MKLNQVLAPVLGFSFTNLSSKHPGVDFSDPSIAAALSQAGDGATPHSSAAHSGSNTAPFRPSAGQGPQLTFKTSSSFHPARDDQCPQPPVLSCSPQAASTDSCCVVTPGGVLVHAQFWDLDVGQPDSWGIHGLWPDKCNGDFYENCDSSRAYTGAQITQSLQQAGAQATLDFMNEFWLSNDESPPSFWAHEWATHGTCVSTLEPTCFDNYQTAQEVAPYFETVVSLFQKFNTYQALASADITPSSSQTYTLSALQNAVIQFTGYTPDFICSGSVLGSVQYYLNAQGPLQDGVFVQSNPSRSSSCPASGIKYEVKTVGQGQGQGQGQDQDEGDDQDQEGDRTRRGGHGRRHRHHDHAARDDL